MINTLLTSRLGQLLLSFLNAKYFLQASIFIVVVTKISVWMTFSDSSKPYLVNDSLNYLKMGDNFASQYLSTSPGEVSLLIAPGFSFMLAILLKLMSVSQISLLLSLQPIGIGLLTYWVLRSHSRIAAKVSMLYIFFEPVLFFESFYILSDTFFLLIFSISVAITIKIYQKPSIQNALLLGLTLGLGTLTRSVLLYFPIFAFIYVLVFLRSLLKYFFASFCVFLIIVGSWIVRNEAFFDVPVVSSVQYKNLILGEVAGIRTLAEGRTLQQIYLDESEIQTRSIGSAPTPRQSYNHNNNRFKEVATKYPHFFALAHLRGIVLILFGFGSESISNIFTSGHESLANIVILISAFFSTIVGLAFVSACVYALFFMPCMRSWLLTAFYFLLVSGGATAYSRFRIPILMIIAIIVFSSLKHRKDSLN